MTQLDLIAARPWRHVTFTTYALSLAFFESVVLEALLRGGGRDIQILSDVAGVSACLSEHGARGAGREYLVEPIAVRHGVFHPKIGVLEDDDENHLLIGSGNLTFAGWGGNFEMLEHLHPSFAGSAFIDAADLFEGIAIDARLRHGVDQRCLQVAARLRKAGIGGRQNGDLRILHTLGRSLTDQIVDLAVDLGGAQKLLIVSPYWDDGAAVRHLCERLGIEQISVHAHPGGTARGSAANWPAKAVGRVSPIQLDFTEDDTRRLHAKAIEVICRHGRLLITGSANATTAAIGRSGNVEVCVARLQRRRQLGWQGQATDRPPPPDEIVDGPDDGSNAFGVLRADLEGGIVRGWVLTPPMSGSGSLFQLSSQGPVALGAVQFDGDGRFEAATPLLELQAWNAARLVLRLETPDGRVAQGFVTAIAASKAMRQAGAIAPRLLALIAGAETPADVAAILDWLYENPERLFRPELEAGGGGGVHGEAAASDILIDVDSLTETVLLGSSRDAVAGATVGGSGWRRFIDQVLGALRVPRGPFPAVADETSEEVEYQQGPDLERQRQYAKDLDQAYDAMAAIIDTLIEPDQITRFGLVAFDILSYVCGRIDMQESRAIEWLSKIMGALTQNALKDERTVDVAACCLLLLRDESDTASARRVRATLRRFGYDVTGQPPRSQMETCFVRPLRDEAYVATLWRTVQAVRTYEELVGDYVASLQSGASLSVGKELEALAPDEWPTLSRAFEGERYRQQVLFVERNISICPRCKTALPSAQARRFRDSLVATAVNCCQRVLIFKGAAS
jgi:hypothetical protein